MTAQSDLWKLLTSRMGQWVSRDDINFTGGEAADRRMRDIRQAVASAGTHLLEERRDKAGRYEYRLTLREDTDSPLERAERLSWGCTKCGAPPWAMKATQPSMDPRWRLGRCLACRTKKATFERVRQEAQA